MTAKARFAPRTAPPEERFWSRVERRGDNECWPWLGSGKDGYGVFVNSVFGTNPAHRISYQLLVGPIPAGLVLDHLCRNPGCVNPAHLEPVTSGENSRRSPLVVKAACQNGHPYVTGSYYLDRGRRCCKECKKISVRAYTERVGRTTATFVCEFCGESRNATGRSKHIKKMHPEHYQPKQPSEGMTPERWERVLRNQRRRRNARAAERRGLREVAS